MDSFFARNRLSAYLDGDLPQDEARGVEAAMSRDPALRAEYEELRRAVDFLRTNGPIAAPEGFANRLHIRLAAEPPPSRLRASLRRVRMDYVGIAAVAAVALLFVGTRHPDATPPAAAPVVAAAQAPGVPEGGGSPAEPTPGAALDHEGGFASTAAAPPASRKSKPGGPGNTAEREPFQADWERDPPAADGSLSTGTSGESMTQSAAVPTLYSPAPWRYRIHAGGANPLKDLMEVAASLGGRIVDGKGRPLADYPMDEGDSQSVRVYVPSYNVEALQRKLKEMGTVDTIATDPEMLYQNGAEVPVSIEVQR